MAINKTKNANLQITISKADYTRLIQLQTELKDILSLDLNKSQVIAFLIRNYGKGTIQADTPKATNKGDFDYQTAIRNLKAIKEMSFKELADYIGISESTLKKYSQGLQKPTENNKKLVDEALIKHGLKQ